MWENAGDFDHEEELLLYDGIGLMVVSVKDATIEFSSEGDPKIMMKIFDWQL